MTCQCSSPPHRTVYNHRQETHSSVADADACSARTAHKLTINVNNEAAIKKIQLGFESHFKMTVKYQTATNDKIKISLN
jgi:hypothetical protein